MGTDVQLIQQHLQGDPQATRALIERHQDLVYNLARRLLGDAEEARDAAQETFLRALESLAGFRGDCTFSTWLYRSAANTCIARSRQRRQRRSREVPAADREPADESAPSSLDLVEQGERDEQLHQAVAELAEPYRVVIALHYFQQLTGAEVAQVLEVPEGTVKARLFRAQRLLQRKLNPRGGRKIR
ncbi:MAG: RNA polymerase sigma factor [Candidatus Latescibacteria bacterium]|nr:RNA polymerase sigma factor [Candidatus Latescibacterota bacterium]